MFSRRAFIGAAAGTGLVHQLGRGMVADAPALRLEHYGYGDVTLAPASLPEQQFRRTQATLNKLSEDDMLKPFRVRAEQPAPGKGLGGWYDDFDPNVKTGARRSHDAFCPGHAFGQWISSFSRTYAADRDPAVREKIKRLLALYSPTINPGFYTNFRFPAYVFDKVNIGLIDAYLYADIPEAKDLFARTAAAAEPHLPPGPLTRAELIEWRRRIGERTSEDFGYDEPYTLPENLYLASSRGLGDYRTLASRYIFDNGWFDQLSRNENVLDGKHAYSHCNSLSSGVQVYLNTGNRRYLEAAANAFRMMEEQSYATGGWGPDERFAAPGTHNLYKSLSASKNSFETPCGAYGHFKIARYLLELSGNAHYGDSIERVLYNTVLGTKDLEANGHAFYYADYAKNAHKFLHGDPWPCCSGTLPQVTADYRIVMYFHDKLGPYVNLYIPSTLRFTSPDGATCRLTQSGDYPLSDTVQFRIETNRPSKFPLRMRIPAWSKSAAVQVNGEPVKIDRTGGWASVARRWSSGDRVTLKLDLALRTEAVDTEHTETVALLRGPLVLFALGENLPKVRREQLLAGTQTSGHADEWLVAVDSQRPILLRPFTSIRDETYNTYWTLA